MGESIMPNSGHHVGTQFGENMMPNSPIKWAPNLHTQLQLPCLPPPPPPRFCAQYKHTWQLVNHYAISKHGSLLISLTKTKSKFKQQAIPSYFSHTNLKQQAKFLSSL